MSALVVLLHLCHWLGFSRADWSYQELPNEPLSHPPQWKSLGTCGGRQQSPVNISTAEVVPVDTVGHLTLFQPLGKTCAASVAERTSHGVKVLLDDCRVVLRADWLRRRYYYLLQMHLHVHAEHAVDGRLYDAELHVVFKSLGANPRLLVLAVLYHVGAKSPLLDPLIHKLDRLTAEGSRASLKDFEFDYETDQKEFFQYNGSLTTPPCTENVHWLVQVEPETVSMWQLRALQQSLLQNGHPNARPLQPLHHRPVLHRTVRSCAADPDARACLTQSLAMDFPEPSTLADFAGQAVPVVIALLLVTVLVLLWRLRRRQRRTDVKVTLLSPR